VETTTSSPSCGPPLKKSLADSVRSLPPEERRAYLRRIAPTERDQAVLRYIWRFWGRPEQFSPLGSWTTWMVCAGRGFGKTRCGSEWVREQVESGQCRRLALIGRTLDDARDVMVEGESGILACSPPWNRPLWEPSKGKLTWPNGALAFTYSGEDPESLRGPQHDGGWGDETAAWRHPETWKQFQLTLRLGRRPRAVVTTTPRPTKLIKALLADPTTFRTRGSTFANASNLADTFLSTILKQFEGTRLGRQELNAEVLDDAPGALWKRDAIEALRLTYAERPLEFRRIVVAVDPANSTGEGACETGIVVVGLGLDGRGYVLEDASGVYSPAEWGAKVIEVYRRWSADRIVAESNNGGNLVESNMRAAVLRDRQGNEIARGANLPIKRVHAKEGKRTRAEPVAALYEQGRVHHVGSFPDLEDQLCSWEAASGQPSPDRLDALVWGLTELFLAGHQPPANNGVIHVRSHRR
jgi:phage terminase large subunit-like protein